MTTDQPPLPGLETAGYLTHDPDSGQVHVAVQVADDGTVEDYIFTWETAVNFGATHKIIALADDGHVTRDEIQSMVDQTRADYIDCFGEAAS